MLTDSPGEHVKFTRGNGMFKTKGRLCIHGEQGRARGMTSERNTVRVVREMLPDWNLWALSVNRDWNVPLGFLQLGFLYIEHIVKHNQEEERVEKQRFSKADKD